MIKLVYRLARRQDVSDATFHTYWRQEHAPKVQQRQRAQRAVKYVQSHTVEPGLNELLRQSRGVEPPYDGITEVWWDDADALRAALGTPEGAQAMRELMEDESTFIDFSRSRVFMTEEHLIF